MGKFLPPFVGTSEPLGVQRGGLRDLHGTAQDAVAWLAKWGQGWLGTLQLLWGTKKKKSKEQERYVVRCVKILEGRLF